MTPQGDRGKAERTRRENPVILDKQLLFERLRVPSRQKRKGSKIGALPYQTPNLAKHGSRFRNLRRIVKKIAAQTSDPLAQKRAASGLGCPAHLMQQMQGLAKRR